MDTSLPGFTRYSLFYVTLLLAFVSCQPAGPVGQWETVAAEGEPVARHEAGLVALDSKLYLLGGRRVNPTSVYDTESNTWENKAPTPLELHHFQPVVWGDAIYILGAMTGPWPNEEPLDRVVIYYPDRDEFVFGDTIPAHRRRGGAGAVVYQDKIYLVGGITHGHMNGYQAWLDEYDPNTGTWRALPDAPHARDHFQAVVTGGKLYALAGRTTSKATDQDMALTVQHGNVFDFRTQQWEPVTDDLSQPTQRAGNSAFAWQGQIVIGGGESTTQVAAHSEVEAYHTQTGQWNRWPALQQGRHGTGLVVVGDYVYTASGCGQRGGEPELTSLERLALPTTQPQVLAQQKDPTPIHQQWHTVTLSFDGPELSETDEYNPFLHYRLSVTLRHEGQEQTLRGYYAADGNAAESSATAGKVWQVRFTPPQQGEWEYTAVLQRGDSLALRPHTVAGESVSITNRQGRFLVVASDKEAPDFRSQGRLGIQNGYFYFPSTDTYWLKAGANSPENLLGFAGIDGTWRTDGQRRDGEAAATTDLHTFTPHLQDWQTGDPQWQDGKGRALIGALNYLAAKGMNAAYFLTFNVLGDGKDVWPHLSPEDFTRFDVSKLAQWEIVFQHMQAQGILLHMVLQETENETLLDGGETGPMRQLYFSELIARYGHHLGLVWNLGEENGPASWSPVGQNDAQRRAMARYIKANDPYQHPVLLHTHSEDPLRSDILHDILGETTVDGLSLQQAQREETAEVVAHWKAQSRESGHEWLITMDEIGMWHTAALTDSLDPWHPTLRRYVLWGSLMSGAAGVEWYFGAHYPHNDLTSEDWRQRDQLWDLTRYAHQFFETWLPYAEMAPAHNLVSTAGGYCLRKPDAVYAVYLPEATDQELDLQEATGTYDVRWYNPRTGGELVPGSILQVAGGVQQNLGTPPTEPLQDWVVLLRKSSD
ncbi:MAG: DUF5060 domain-containing protein [Bacteroidota bacterium]